MFWDGIPFPGLPLAGMASSVVDAFRLSNTAGKVIVLIHVFGSVLAWSIMVTKLRVLRSSASSSQHFLDAYRRQPHLLSLWKERRRFADSPVHEVYAAISATAEQALLISEPAAGEGHGGGGPDGTLTGTNVEHLRRVAEGAAAEQVLQLEWGMPMLAVAISAGPSLGLLGTVWGVMEAFGAMSSGGSAMLSAVAPGISGALLTTVTGLLVALPSVVVYNLLAAMTQRLTVRMELFSQAMIMDLEHRYCRPSRGGGAAEG